MRNDLRRRLGLPALLALALLAPGRARADLLDEDDKPPPPPTPKPSIPDEVQAPPDQPSYPSTTPKKGTPPASDGKKSPAGGKSTAPHSLPDNDEEASPHGQTTSVLPPKKGPKAAKPKGAKPEAQEPVHFKSEGLKGLRERGEVELMQNVVVTQGTMRLEAQHAKIFFDEKAHDVVKVVADGDVKMFKVDEDSGEKIKAFGNEVVFDNKARTVVMEGNARLWRGADLVRGKKITYEMDSGWIFADRIAGEVHAPDKDQPKSAKDLDAPDPGPGDDAAGDTGKGATGKAAGGKGPGAKGSGGQGAKK
jgi:lipopolysaccharide export system protein LptA